MLRRLPFKKHCLLVCSPLVGFKQSGLKQVEDFAHSSSKRHGEVLLMTIFTHHLGDLLFV